MKPTHVSIRAALRSLLLLLPCLSLLSTASITPAQQSANLNAQPERAALHQSLLDLSNPWTVMCVAAHPDDEDGATLTVLRRKYGVHTVTLFSTYGEGGQNAIGPELYEELGAIRARETLAAAEIQGSEAWFLALRDFGFSKSAEEAFRVWGHDEALRRLVLKIRTLHPDVIITNHDTKSGHGHHQATGRLVMEAFEAAADPRRFPEQLSQPGVTTWQPQRLFVRVRYESGTGSKALEEAAEREGKIISVNPNERDPLRGSTYAEQALQALHQHASQGPWPASVPQAGAPIIRYRLAREAATAAPFPSGAQTFLEGLQLPPIAAKLSPVTIDGQPLTSFVDQPARAFAAILASRSASNPAGNFNGSDDEPHLRLMNERTNRALAALSGITATLKPQDDVLIPNSSASFLLNIRNGGDREAIIQRVSFKGSGKSKELKAPSRLAPKAEARVSAGDFIRPDAQLSVPHAAHLYDSRVFGQQFQATVQVAVGGKSFTLPVTTRVDVAPAIEIASVEPSPVVLTPATLSSPFNLSFTLVNHQRTTFRGALAESKLKYVGPSGRILEIAARQSKSITLPFVLPSSNASARHGGKHIFTDDASFTILPLNKNLLQPSTLTQHAVRVVYADARTTPRLRVAYVRSFDDTLRNALNSLGVEAKELTIKDVQTGDLKPYDTIIIDNRGYQAHPELVAANTRLLEYTHAGGTLIVFYHKTNEWNPDAQKKRPQLAPYPILLDSSRVTDETAPVTFTEPQNALLNFPNRIGPEDFDGWIQERGLYYPKEWDARYSAPLATSDAGEAPLRGGLLAADYGRGHYIYTSMVWYRQLRAGVPGAYRIFANMISYGHTNAQ
jgi:LmbE family N-acetylglucosaminyl deacetylase